MMAANYSKHAKKHRKRAMHVHGGDYFIVSNVPSVHTVCGYRRQPHATHDVARTIIDFYNSYQGEMHNRTPGFHQTAKPSTT